MASNEKSTAFRQYNFCVLCKLSHKLGKKHIYSKRHQQILQSISKKFSDKIKKIKKDLFSPVVQDGSFEREARFWCYFCKEEYLKHEIVEEFSVVGARLLQHISSADHKSNMDQFFWDNLLKKELKPQFILPAEDLYIFKKAALLAVKKRQKSEELARKKVAEKIAFLEKKRLSESAVKATSLEDLPGNAHSGTSLVGSDVLRLENRYQSITGRKKTVSARADGLTVVGKDVPPDTEEGNVHSGALPPWLQPDAESRQSSTIGPTMQDFQKHLEREKKSKLPANRVGANFDHTASTSHDWLPSFGRVWSKGRRLQSKQHFERELKKEGFGKRKQKSSTISSTSHISVNNQSEQFVHQQHSSTESSNKYSSSQIHSNSRFDWSKRVNSAEHVSSHTKLLDNSAFPQADEVKSVPNIMSDFEQPITCNPYKRKRDVSHDVKHPSPGSLPVSERWSHGEVGNPYVSYKRHKYQTNNRSVDQMKLIHTPVLATDTSK